MVECIQQDKLKQFGERHMLDCAVMRRGSDKKPGDNNSEKGNEVRTLLAPIDQLVASAHQRGSISEAVKSLSRLTDNTFLPKDFSKNCTEEVFTKDIKKAIKTATEVSGTTNTLLSFDPSAIFEAHKKLMKTTLLGEIAALYGNVH